jgi:hypothetical protein
MAMVRTVFSPRCWATSSTSRNGWPERWSMLVVSSAFWIGGRWPSNSTSTTALITCTMRPLGAVAVALVIGSAEALRAAGFLAGLAAMGRTSF